MTRRIERLNEQVKREVSDILRYEVRDPRVGVITVTEARVAPDLSIARVYVRPMGDEKEQSDAMEGLEAASLSARLSLRRYHSILILRENRCPICRSVELERRSCRALAGCADRRCPCSNQCFCRGNRPGLPPSAAPR